MVRVIVSLSPRGRFGSRCGCYGTQARTYRETRRSTTTVPGCSSPHRGNGCWCREGRPWFGSSFHSPREGGSEAHVRGPVRLSVPEADCRAHPAKIVVVPTAPTPSHGFDVGGVLGAGHPAFTPALRRSPAKGSSVNRQASMRALVSRPPQNEHGVDGSCVTWWHCAQKCSVMHSSSSHA